MSFVASILIKFDSSFDFDFWISLALAAYTVQRYSAQM